MNVESYAVSDNWNTKFSAGPLYPCQNFFKLLNKKILAEIKDDAAEDNEFSNEDIAMKAFEADNNISIHLDPTRIMKVEVLSLMFYDNYNK